MVEIGASGNCYKEKGPEATIMYVWSLFHCLPVGSNAPGNCETSTMQRITHSSAYSEQPLSLNEDLLG